MFTTCRSLVFLTLLFWVQACAVPGPGGHSGPSPSQRPTAFVEVSGSEVWINGRPAAHGERLRPGDNVSTGHASSARIVFSDGTVIQLAENTDPDFSWSSVVATGEETLDVVVDFGWMLIDTGSELSVRVFNQLADVFYHSAGIVEARPNRFRAYLLRGRLTPLRPAVRGLVPFELIEVRPGRQAQIKRFSRAEARKLRSLFAVYDFGRRELPEKRVQVPNLQGQVLKQAIATLEAAGLKRGRTEKVAPRGNQRSGTVVRQSLRAGSWVERGRVVDLVVAQVERVRTPNLRGLALDEAAAVLKERGLLVGRIEGPTRGTRVVVGQSPAAGKRVPKGSRVNIDVQQVIY